MPIEITAYACEFCGRPPLRSKSGMKKHEDSCFSNPKNKACQTCAHDLGHNYRMDEKAHKTNCRVVGGECDMAVLCASWKQKDAFF